MSLALRAFQTATTTASGGGSLSPTDTNANPNLFGNSGPTPVIPAFVLSGVLLIVLVSICTWRRMLASRHQAGLVARYGPFGITFVPASNVEGGPFGGGRRREERIVVLGPKPELYDAYTGREKWVEEKEGKEKEVVDESTWKGMKPLSLSLGRNSTASEKAGDPSELSAASETESSRQPYLLRKVLRLKHKRSERKTDSASLPEISTHDVEVSVLIRMPSPTRPRPRRFSSDAISVEKEKERADFYDDANDSDDFNYSLGVATVPLVVDASQGSKSR